MIISLSGTGTWREWIPQWCRMISLFSKWKPDRNKNKKINYDYIKIISIIKNNSEESACKYIYRNGSNNIYWMSHK